MLALSFGSVAAREQQATKLRTFAQALVVGGADPLHDLELVRSAEIEIEIEIEPTRSHGRNTGLPIGRSDCAPPLAS